MVDTRPETWFTVGMTTNHHPAAGTPGRKEATMAAIHATTVTPATPADEAVPFGGGNFTLRCTCGEQVTYSGRNFTAVEAQRHQAWHEKVGR
jgi:hypothetical protein